MTAQQRIYLTEDRTRAVLDGPEARYLLVGEGCEVPEAEARKFGIVGGYLGGPPKGVVQRIKGRFAKRG